MTLGMDYTGSYDPIDIGTAVEKLSDMGFSPSLIASVLDKPVAIVRSVISRRAAPEDKELADEVRRLCLTAIRRGFWLLENGTGAERMRVMMACINGSTRMLQAAAAASGQEVKTDFIRLMTSLRDVPSRETIVTAGEGIVDVEARPAAGRTEDQD